MSLIETYCLGLSPKPFAALVTVIMDYLDPRQIELYLARQRGIDDGAYEKERIGAE